VGVGGGSGGEKFQEKRFNSKSIKERRRWEGQKGAVWWGNLRAAQRFLGGKKGLREGRDSAWEERLDTRKDADAGMERRIPQKGKKEAENILNFRKSRDGDSTSLKGQA